MKTRYHSADIYRAFALLLVMIYHSWVTLGYPNIGNRLLVLPVKLGGELGVTMFFLLSGFGIYHSLEGNVSRNGKLNLKEYYWGRIRRIVPNYYVSLLITAALTGAACYLGLAGIKDLLTHALFVHNLFPSTHGSINGVLWTMGVMVQFYVIAPFLYRAMKKWPVLTVLLSAALSILLKIALFHSILPSADAPQVYYFIYSRQLLTALDNFVIGLFAAYVCGKYRFSDKKKVLPAVLEAAALIFVLCWCFFGDRYGIYTDTLSGYVWHSGLAIGLGAALLASVCADRSYGKAWKPLLWLSRNEYGIYIWHYLIMVNVLQYSGALQQMQAKGYWILIMIFQIGISVLTGSLIADAVDHSTAYYLGKRRN